MNLSRLVTSVALLLPLVAGTAAAQATQVVNFEVQAIDNIAFTGTPSLIVSAAPAGGGPTSVTDATATYAITTNQSNRKITAQIDAAMPTDVTLSVTLAAPAGATSTGAIDLTTTAQDVVTGISNASESGLGVTYTLSAAETAAPTGPSSRTVTYTVIAGI